MNKDDYSVITFSSSTVDLSTAMYNAINAINQRLGTIEHILQSQSTHTTGTTIVTVTIVYKTGRQ